MHVIAVFCFSTAGGLLIGIAVNLHRGRKKKQQPVRVGHVDVEDLRAFALKEKGVYVDEKIIRNYILALRWAVHRKVLPENVPEETIYRLFIFYLADNQIITL